MRIALLLLAVLTLGLVAAACSDDGDGGEPDAVESPVEGETPDDDGDDEPAGDGDEPANGVVGDGKGGIPQSALAAPLIDVYDTATPGVDPAADALPVPAGTIIVRWLQSDGFYVAHYDGLDLTVTGPICPGNSNRTSSGVFENISNAPTGAGACSTATTLVPAPVGVRLCGDEVLYRTAIPIDVADGLLFGSLERYRDDGTIVGLTSQVGTNSAAAPEVDLGDCDTPEA